MAVLLCYSEIIKILGLTAGRFVGHIEFSVVKVIRDESVDEYRFAWVHADKFYLRRFQQGFYVPLKQSLHYFEIVDDQCQVCLA